MSKFFINLFIRFGRSESLRKGVLFILKDLSAKSDNDIDDAIVKMIEEKLENITGGLITCSGSEQGMQGHYEDDECVESYLSVDIGEFETA